MVKDPTYFRNRYLFIADLFFIICSVFGSFLLRFELGPLFTYYLPQAYWMVLIALILKPIAYHWLGMYRRVWAYISINELKFIAAGVSLGSTFVAIGILILTNLQIQVGGYLGFPRSVLIIDWLLSILGVGGMRLALRLAAEYASISEHAQGRKRRVLIVGAGSAGNLVVRELEKNPQLNQVAVGFLDDDPAKQKLQVRGIPIVGKLSDLPRTIHAKRADEVLIALPSAPGQIVRQVAETCRKEGIPSRTMPGIYELLGGNITISRLREVNITDLLRRKPVAIDSNLVGLSISGKSVLVTGAGGSIGRELCRQIARWGPSDIVLLGHGENSIFETLIELSENFPALPLYPVIADVRNSNRLYTVFEKHRPDVVFHAAAHKHVPLMEANVEEAVTNNVLGTRNVLDMAVSFNTERLVMISSDKAVKPSSVMGATKRVAEMLVVDAANRTGRSFSVVRFGNVLGSRGSIVPLFKRQIAKGGPITVTDPEMRRYFMTIPEAVHLVLQAAAMGNGSEVFVLNMGQQIRILKLAEDLIRLSGLEPGQDIEIVFTGVRPGEKLSEQLWEAREDSKETTHPKILRLKRAERLGGRKLTEAVGELIYLAREGDSGSILRLLDKIIPGATVSSTPPPDLISVI